MPQAQTSPAVSRHPGAARVVAVGDVHGDLGALKRALTLAELIEPNQETWRAGDAVLVQTGDLLDRGDDEPEIMTFLYALREQARAAGGDVVLLLGNHETMNAQGDLRYVTPEGFADFADTPQPSDPAFLKVSARAPERARGRIAAFSPGGPWAKKLATHQAIAVVGDTVFVHGGVLPKHVAYGVDKINAEVRAWLLGRGDFPKILHGEDSPLWSRHYSKRESPAACALLDETLKALKVSRMVVGHTPQPDGPSPACGGKVWRIDVGMAAHYGGAPAAWEISEGRARAITPQATP